MKLPLSLLIYHSLVASCSCSSLPTPEPAKKHPKLPTIYLCGDSTEAPGGGGNGTEGWGQYFHYSFDPKAVYVNDSAIVGRSARSYTREGRFNTIAALLKLCDWVTMSLDIMMAGVNIRQVVTMGEAIV
jgi:rhamnogalacturonan acetylesterase